MGQLHLIPLREDWENSCRLAESCGAAFEYNDFFDPELLADEGRFQEALNFFLAQKRDRSRDTLHGAFYDVTVHSDDPDVRAISEKRVRQSMDAARALGVRGVVFHTNLVPNFTSAFYVDHWLERSRDFFTAVCREYAPIEVYMENMFDMAVEPILRLAEAMRDVPNFGVCLDYAHASVFGPDAADWLRRLAPYVKHMHINDNNLLEDQHLAVGEGKIDWAVFDAQMRALGLDPSVLIETRNLARQEASLRFMEARGIWPFPSKEEV